MANYNLTSQQIKDTYEQLTQISGSVLVDGTGSAVTNLDVSASYATNALTASYVENASATWPVSGTPSGLVSSSAQVDLSQATGVAASASNATNAGFIDVTSSIDNQNRYVAFAERDSGNSAIKINSNFLYNPSTDTLTVGTVIADVTGDLTGNADTATSATTATSASYATNSDTLDGLQASAFAQTAQNNSFSGTQTFNDIVVNGTASVAYLESVTGSAKIIGDAYIILNNDTPVQRYAGVVVQDSGSTNNTASLEFDGQTNDWFYEYTDDGGATAEFGTVMFGPGYNTKGSHVYPSNNRILKGTGDHHIVDSSITDDGSTVSFSAELNVTGAVTASAGFKGDLDGNAATATTASYIAGITSAGLVSGTGTDSMKSADSLTTTSATAAAIRSIALGNDAEVTAAGDDSVAIGSISQVTGTYAVAIGSGADALASHAVSIGSGATASGLNSIAIGKNTFMTASNGISIGGEADGIFKYDGSSKITLNSNVEVTGQLYTPTFAGTIASSTSSIDFDNGNFATLDCSAGSTFLANPSNLESGTTYTVIITNGANIGNYGTAWKFAGGTQPTLSANTDVLTCVSDGTNLYATALADFS
jgi:hypothetical protein